MKEVTAKELKAKFDNKEEFQLIDVREEYEYDICNLNGKLIPMGTIFDNVGDISKDKQVIIYCRSGNRSGVVINELERRFGFTNLYNLKGGILGYARDVDSTIPTY